jgi:hypothetical protein
MLDQRSEIRPERCVQPILVGFVIVVQRTIGDGHMFLDEQAELSEKRLHSILPPLRQ